MVISSQKMILSQLFLMSFFYGIFVANVNTIDKLPMVMIYLESFSIICQTFS